MKNIKDWESPACNLCNSFDMKTIYKNMTYWEYKGKFKIVKCMNCDLVFTCPRPKLSEMEKYYETEMYFGLDMGNENKVDKDSREIHYGPIYDLIFKMKKKGKILDIGAGTGMLLSKFKDSGWEVDGVELTKSAVSFAKKEYGIKLRQGDFLKKKINAKYDVVVLNGALEHLHKPLETLIKANNILKKGGLLVVSIPNSAGIGRRIFGKNWFAWQPPRHLYHFSPKTIKKIFIKSGFRNPDISFSFSSQNYYILFQSARYMLSPKFKKTKEGGLKDQKKAFKKEISVKKEIGKIFFSLFSFLVLQVEPTFNLGEVMIVYAKK